MLTSWMGERLLGKVRWRLRKIGCHVKEREDFFIKELANNMSLSLKQIGINPGLMAAFKGHHYAGPGNHFCKLSLVIITNLFNHCLVKLVFVSNYIVLFEVMCMESWSLCAYTGIVNRSANKTYGGWAFTLLHHF